MNVHVYQDSSTSLTSSTGRTSGFGVVCVILGLAVIGSLYLGKHKKGSNAS